MRKQWEPSDAWVDEFVDHHPGGATLEAIGDALGLSRQRVNQVVELALAKAIRALSRRGITSTSDLTG